MDKETIIAEIVRISHGDMSEWKLCIRNNKRNGYVCLDAYEWDNLQYAIIEYLIEELISSITKPMSICILDLFVKLHNEQTQIGGWRGTPPLNIDDILSKVGLA